MRYTLEMMVATTCGREHEPPHYTTPEDRLNDQRRNKTGMLAHLPLGDSGTRRLEILPAQDIDVSTNSHLVS